MTKKDMKELNQKNFKKLPEQVKKDKAAQKHSERMASRQKVAELNKKVKETLTSRQR